MHNTKLNSLRELKEARIEISKIIKIRKES